MTKCTNSLAYSSIVYKVLSSTVALSMLFTGCGQEPQATSVDASLNAVVEIKDNSDSSQSLNFSEADGRSDLLKFAGDRCPSSHPVLVGQKLNSENNPSSLCSTSEFALSNGVSDEGPEIKLIWWLVIAGIPIVGYASWSLCNSARAALGGSGIFCQPGY